METAYQIEINDPAIQAYIWRHPLCAGPDLVLNRKCRAAIIESFKARPPAEPGTVTRLAKEQTELPAEVMQRLTGLFDQLSITPGGRAYWINDYGWEVNLIPGSPKRILVFGCGDGAELLFLRAAFPEADITAIDFRNSLLSNLAEVARVNFIEDDLIKHFREFRESSFDLIYSNHTMEHFFTPDDVLSSLNKLLIYGGVMISTLPLDGEPGTPFLSQIKTQIKEIYPLDVALIDPCHSWKTTKGDLIRTLKNAGFSRVELFQRSDHVSRFRAANMQKLQSQRESSLRRYSLTIGPMRNLMRSLFPREVPYWVLRVFFALERRSGMSPNIIKNNFAEEALFRAVR